VETICKATNRYSGLVEGEDSSGAIKVVKGVPLGLKVRNGNGGDGSRHR
jgi:hypothetical protein